MLRSAWAWFGLTEKRQWEQQSCDFRHGWQDLGCDSVTSIGVEGH